MSFIKIWRGHTMIEEIQDCACYNFITSTPEMLEKNRGHTVEPEAFRGYICFRAILTSCAV